LITESYLQESGRTKEPQAFQEIELNEVVLSVGIHHPRKVGIFKFQ